MAIFTAQSHYGRLDDPAEFLTELGEQIDAEIEDRYLKYAGPDAGGENTEDKRALDLGDEPGGQGSVRGARNTEPASKGELGPVEDVPPAS